MLSERLFQLLLALIEADGELLDRESLAQRIWGAEGVTDGNLTQHIYLLRELLGEERDGRSYIVTIPRRGYRFAATASIVSAEPDAALRPPPPSPRVEARGSQALQHYCSGSYLLDRRTAPALQAAVRSFEAALQIDESFGPALVGLGRAWALLAEYWHVPSGSAMVLARRSIERAIELDPRSPPALAALSEIQLFSDWDWPKSWASLDAALTFDPRLAYACNNAAWYYLYRREFDRAALQAREALMIEPASLPLQLLGARVALHSGKVDEAAASISKILTIDPDFFIARRFLALAHIVGGDPDRAIEEISMHGADSSEDAVYRLPMLVCAYAIQGEKEKAAQTYGKLQELGQRRYVSSWNFALGAANCGREDEALWLLRDAYAQRDPALFLLPLLPLFSSIESRSDFKEILRDIAA
ncbi:MAG TPA: winged helix-turn-helix domain-containing protein [Candidatus Cybelea sp.]